jgi:hypothetical protein
LVTRRNIGAAEANAKGEWPMGTHLSATVAEGRAFMQFIDGKPVDALSGERISVVCPSDGNAFASVPASGEVEMTCPSAYSVL